MTRIFSGVKPTGHLTLGNYLGAVRGWVEVDQHRADALFSVVDLHALTVEHDPARVRRLSRQAATLLLAAGLDPALCTVFVQSHVDEHARLSYLLECTATDGELRRMIQYKEKSARALASGESVRFSLLSYPALMAADILAYRTDEVPVGDDQTQHVELTRDLAVRFNQRYGHTFVVPRATRPPVAARVMDLQDPTSKMGKSHESGAGIVYLLDDADVARKKIMRAVTDSGQEVEYDPEAKPGWPICWRSSRRAEPGVRTSWPVRTTRTARSRRTRRRRWSSCCVRCGSGTRRWPRIPVTSTGY